MNKKHLSAAVVAGVLAVSALGACSSDDDGNDNPGTGVVDTTISGGTDTTTLGTGPITSDTSVTTTG